MSKLSEEVYEDSTTFVHKYSASARVQVLYGIEQKSPSAAANIPLVDIG